MSGGENILAWDGSVVLFMILFSTLASDFSEQLHNPFKPDGSER